MPRRDRRATRGRAVRRGGRPVDDVVGAVLVEVAEVPVFKPLAAVALCEAVADRCVREGDLGVRPAKQRGRGIDGGLVFVPNHDRVEFRFARSSLLRIAVVQRVQRHRGGAIDATGCEGVGDGLAAVRVVVGDHRRAVAEVPGELGRLADLGRAVVELEGGRCAGLGDAAEGDLNRSIRRLLDDVRPFHRARPLHEPQVVQGISGGVRVLEGTGGRAPRSIGLHGRTVAPVHRHIRPGRTGVDIEHAPVSGAFGPRGVAGHGARWTEDGRTLGCRFRERGQQGEQRRGGHPNREEGTHHALPYGRGGP